MKVRGQHYRTIWPKEGDDRVIQLIDQRFLPHRFVIEEVRTVAEMAAAIREMHVRGAGLIGAAAGYGMYLATFDGSVPRRKIESDERTTAVNPPWASDAVAQHRAAKRKETAGRFNRARIAAEAEEY